MADLTKRNARVSLLDFSYTLDGELKGVSAQVVSCIYDGETVLTTAVQTIPVELTDGIRKALAAIIKRLVE